MSTSAAVPKSVAFTGFVLGLLLLFALILIVVGLTAPALKITSMRQVDGLKETDAADLIATRYQPFSSVYDLWERSGVGPKSLEKLAAADAYRSLGLDRRQALWEVRALHPSEPLPLFAFAETQDSGTEESVQLPSMIDAQCQKSRIAGVGFL